MRNAQQMFLNLKLVFSVVILKNIKEYIFEFVFSFKGL